MGHREPICKFRLRKWRLILVLAYNRSLRASHTSRVRGQGGAPVRRNLQIALSRNRPPSGCIKNRDTRATRIPHRLLAPPSVDTETIEKLYITAPFEDIAET